MGCKWCPRCQWNQSVADFPVDRSRRDGRWHSCRSCAKAYWEQRGRLLRLARSEKQCESRQLNVQGLEGLRRYSHQPQERFESVPPSLRPAAQLIFNRSLEKARRQGRPLTQPLLGLFYASAASNAVRLGNRSFAARMSACKRWKRHRERQLSEERSPARPQVRMRRRLLPLF
jgi:hypothetical protein